MKYTQTYICIEEPSTRIKALFSGCSYLYNTTSNDSRSSQLHCL